MAETKPTIRETADFADFHGFQKISELDKLFSINPLESVEICEICGYSPPIEFGSWSENAARMRDALQYGISGMEIRKT